LQREPEEICLAIHNMVVAELTARGIPYLLVSGDAAQRLALVERHLPD
jgi:hypothetical protein